MAICKNCFWMTLYALLRIVNLSTRESMIFSICIFVRKSLVKSITVWQIWKISSCRLWGMQLQNTSKKSSRKSLSLIFRWSIFGLISWRMNFKKLSISSEGVFSEHISLTFCKCGKIMLIKSILMTLWDVHFKTISFRAYHIFLNRCILSLVRMEYSSQEINGWIIWNKFSCK